MSLAIKVYEVFKDDTEKARVLSEVINEIESHLSPLKDVATKGDLEITKLALQKEIEEVRLSLEKEIEQVRGEIVEVRLSLQKEIEQVRGEIVEVRLSLQKEIEQVKAGIIKWVAGLLIVQTGVLVSLISILR